jgi:uncharacterized protein
MVPTTIIAAGNHVRGLIDALGPLRKHALAIDLFADRDTCADIRGSRRVSELQQIAGRVSILSDAKRPTEVLWAGGVENSPGLIEQTERDPGMLSLGSSATSIRRVRDPFLLHQTLLDNGIPVLPVRRKPPTSDSDNWLAKPFCSGGGIGVQRYTNDKSLPADRDFYFQRFSPGVVMGGTLTTNRGRAELHGVCEHLGSTSADLPFRYEGSVGPIGVNDGIRDWVSGIGDLVATEFHLRGWFGIDFICGPGGKCWLLEVNPRFCFSMELIDRRWPGLLVRRHLAAFPESNLPQISPVVQTDSSEYKQAELLTPIFASRVLFNDSDEDVRVDNDVAEWLWIVNRMQGRLISDIPRPGTVYHPGEPVCTVFWSGQTRLAAIKGLNEWATTVRNRLGLNGSSVPRILQSRGPEFR